MRSLIFFFLVFSVNINTFSAILFKIHIIKPKFPLSWSSPSALSVTTGLNSVGNDYAPIGNFAIELKCSRALSNGVKSVLTGMERVSKKESQRINIDKKLGLGSFIWNFAGQLVSAKTTKEELVMATKES